MATISATYKLKGEKREIKVLSLTQLIILALDLKLKNVQINLLSNIFC